MNFNCWYICKTQNGKNYDNSFKVKDETCKDYNHIPWILSKVVQLDCNSYLAQQAVQNENLMGGISEGIHANIDILSCLIEIWSLQKEAIYSLWIDWVYSSSCKHQNQHITLSKKNIQSFHIAACYRLWAILICSSSWRHQNWSVVPLMLTSQGLCLQLL